MLKRAPKHFQFFYYDYFILIFTSFLVKSDEEMELGKCFIFIAMHENMVLKIQLIKKRP